MALKDNLGKTTSILVAGGSGEDEYESKYGLLKSTELLQIKGMVWTFGPDLLMGSSGATLIDSPSSEYTAVIIGGHKTWGPQEYDWNGTSIYGLDRMKNKWVSIGDLKRGRNSATAIRAPLDFFHGCE